MRVDAYVQARRCQDKFAMAIRNKLKFHVEQLKGNRQSSEVISMTRIWRVFLLGLLALLGTVGVYSCSSSPKPTDYLSSVDSTTSYEIPVYTYKVINAYPHDRNAFTQGLAFENGFLYEGTGLHGRSTLRRVELETGHILQMREIPAQFFGEGITLYENKIIQLTWQSNVGFVYDKDSFELLQEFNYPNEGWGITYDGTRLIMSDGTATLHFLDPETFDEIGQIEVCDNDSPVTRLNELEYVQGEIYANVWQVDCIARISPNTGRVIGWIDLDGLLSLQDRSVPVDVLNGIAYDQKDDRLFVTGKFWPRVFEIVPVSLK